MKLHRATPEDNSFLLSVYASTRAQELDQVQWGAGQREAFLKSQFEMQRREYDAKFPDREYNVIEIDDRPAKRFDCWILRCFPSSKTGAPEASWLTI
jgi:hypothetical protein